MHPTPPPGAARAQCTRCALRGSAGGAGSLPNVDGGAGESLTLPVSPSVASPEPELCGSSIARTRCAATYCASQAPWVRSPDPSRAADVSQERRQSELVSERSGACVPSFCGTSTDSRG